MKTWEDLVKESAYNTSLQTKDVLRFFRNLRKKFYKTEDKQFKKIVAKFLELSDELYSDGVNEGYQDAQMEGMPTECELQDEYKRGYKDGHKKGLMVGRNRKVKKVYENLL
jgi:flagellar biosynthesis/type III secretory pathway protein FliH